MNGGKVRWWVRETESIQHFWRENKWRERAEEKGGVKKMGWLWQEGRRGSGKAKLPVVLQADYLSR